MFFTIKNKSKYLQQFKAEFLSFAKSKIKHSLPGYAEIPMDRYLQEKFDKNLKQTCLELLDNLSFNSDKEDVIIIFKDPKADELATLITYGNMEVKGCDFFVSLFRKKGAEEKEK